MAWSIEHDNAPPQDGVLSLIARMEEHKELDCIGGLYFTKGEASGRALTEEAEPVVISGERNLLDVEELSSNMKRLREHKGNGGSRYRNNTRAADDKRA